jgi:ABC-type transport system involved in multi-copper enzyme maturation permease subunit
VKMNAFWEKAVKVTGSVAVVGFIFSLAIENIFQNEVLKIFGSERAYYLTAIIIVALAISLIASIILRGKKVPGDENKSLEAHKQTVTIKRSKITGDVILGSKRDE